MGFVHSVPRITCSSVLTGAGLLQAPLADTYVDGHAAVVAPTVARAEVRGVRCSSVFLSRDQRLQGPHSGRVSLRLTSRLRGHVETR